MTRAPLTAAFVVTSLAWVTAAVLVAQSTPDSSVARSPKPVGPAAASAQRKAAAAAPAARSPQPVALAGREAAVHRSFLSQYCLGCHNTRAPQPAGDPVDLEAASLDDLIPHAATWERVLRKLR